MKIIIFDQASSKTGYALFNETNLTRWGVLDLSKEKNIEVRLRDMCNQINTIIAKTKPDLVIFEDVSLRTSVKTLIILSRIQGCIMQDCYDKNLDFIIYAPTQWRKILEIAQSNKIKRPELKKQAIAFVKNSYGITVGDDCAEAICIGLAHLKKNGILPNLNDIKENLDGEKNKQKNINNPD